MIVLIFDTETTGLPKIKTINMDVLDKWPYIVQLSYVIFDTNEHQLLAKRDWIIKLPVGMEISEEVSNIHGITTLMSHTQGTNMKYVLEEFINDCKNVDFIVAHNIAFDLEMIHVEIERQRLQKNYNIMKYDNFYLMVCKKMMCTMKSSIELCNIIRLNKNGEPYLKYPKLSELHEKLFNTSPSNLHNSFNDVIICLRCFYKMKFDRDVMELNSEIRSFGFSLNI